jgi:hypothetical protein
MNAHEDRWIKALTEAIKRLANQMGGLIHMQGNVIAGRFDPFDGFDGNEDRSASVLDGNLLRILWQMDLNRNWATEREFDVLEQGTGLFVCEALSGVIEGLGECNRGRARRMPGARIYRRPSGR